MLLKKTQGLTSASELKSIYAAVDGGPFRKRVTRYTPNSRMSKAFDSNLFKKTITHEEINFEIHSDTDRCCEWLFPRHAGAGRERPNRVPINSAFGQADNTFNLIVPVMTSSVQQGRSRKSQLALSEPRTLDEDVSLMFADVPGRDDRTGRIRDHICDSMPRSH